MEYRILVNLEDDELSIEENAAWFVEQYGDIEAYFIAQALKQLVEKIETFTKDAIVAQAVEQGKMTFGQYEVAPVKGRDFYDFSEIPEWTALEAQKRATAESVKKLEAQLKKQIQPIEQAAPTVRVTMVKAPRINPTQGFERPNLDEL